MTSSRNEVRADPLFREWLRLRPALQQIAERAGGRNTGVVLDNDQAFDLAQRLTDSFHSLEPAASIVRKADIYEQRIVEAVTSLRSQLPLRLAHPYPQGEAIIGWHRYLITGDSILSVGKWFMLNVMPEDKSDRWLKHERGLRERMFVDAEHSGKGFMVAAWPGIVDILRSVKQVCKQLSAAAPAVSRSDSHLDTAPIAGKLSPARVYIEGTMERRLPDPFAEWVTMPEEAKLVEFMNLLSDALANDGPPVPESICFADIASDGGKLHVTQDRAPYDLSEVRSVLRFRRSGAPNRRDYETVFFARQYGDGTALVTRQVSDNDELRRVQYHEIVADTEELDLILNILRDGQVQRPGSYPADTYEDERPFDRAQRQY